MGSSRVGSRASRSRSTERSRSDRSHRDRRDSERESSRSRHRSRSHERSSVKFERRRRSLSRSRSPTPDAPAKRRDDERSSSKRRSRSRSRSREGKKRSRRRERSASVSSSSDEDSFSSSSESDGSVRKHRRKKDAKKHKKKPSKKDTKKKHKKKHKKKKSKGAATAVNQNAYGKYGILRESDFHTKSQSFHAWLRDIKKIVEFNGPKWEAMEMFKEYMEDFNTATLPHEKYYDIEKYDMQQYQKQQLKRSRDGKSGSGPLVVDEEALRRERHAQRLAREQDDFKLVLQTMDAGKIEAMRRQEHLRAQMQMHYKAGDVAEARRIEQLLRADEDAAKKR